MVAVTVVNKLTYSSLYDFRKIKIYRSIFVVFHDHHGLLTYLACLIKCLQSLQCRSNGWKPALDQCQKGATENARPDIARLDNAAPFRKGGHRETCFSVHHKFMFDAGSRPIIWAIHRFCVCSSISFCFTYFYMRQTKLASSLVNVWVNAL